MKVTLVFTLCLMLMAAMMASASEDCVCPFNYDPVCGRDGITYSNSCGATCAGVQEEHKGACGGSQS